MLGNSILSVNSYQAANDLLNKKGAIYSDRPRLPMVKELLVLLYRRGFDISHYSQHGMGLEPNSQVLLGRIFYLQENCAAEIPGTGRRHALSTGHAS